MSELRQPSRDLRRVRFLVAVDHNDEGGTCVVFRMMSNLLSLLVVAYLVVTFNFYLHVGGERSQVEGIEIEKQSDLSHWRVMQPTMSNTQPPTERNVAPKRPAQGVGAFHSKRDKFHVDVLSPVLQGSMVNKAKTAINESHNNHQTGGIAVFYNVFIPYNKTEQELLPVYQAISEQIGQIATSVHSQASINIINIGRPIVEGFVDGVCAQNKHLTCIHKRYYETGFEELTLTELYDHCIGNKQDKVIYMHNKGSYHGRLKDGWSYIRQDVWRRMGTMAATSDMCLSPIGDNMCDFCGLIATPLPWLHVPGNFWSARCSYLRRLLHPQAYQRAMNRYRQEYAEPRVNNGTMSMRFAIRNKVCFGDRRWAAENWIGSHPSVLPCDLANVSDIRHWQTVDRNGTEFSFSRAPRQNLRFMMDKSLPRIPPFLLSRPDLRIRDYHLLGGMITRWQQLYNKVPSSSSWVWSYYPDGQVWQEALAEHGNHTFERVISTLLQS